MIHRYVDTYHDHKNTGYRNYGNSEIGLILSLSKFANSVDRPAGYARELVQTEIVYIFFSEAKAKPIKSECRLLHL